MTTLYGWGPMFDLPGPSPYVMKADIQMQMLGVPFKRAIAELDSVAKGKAPAGHIRLELGLVDGRFLLTLRDDGRGLPVERIKQKALDKGLIAPGQALSAQETAQLIFLPGFSTAEQVTEVSGRGVGMDAVQNFVEREEGSIELRLLSSASADGYCPFETVISLPGKLAVQGVSG